MLRQGDVVRCRVTEARGRGLLLTSGEHRIYTLPPKSLRDGDRWRGRIAVGDEFDVEIGWLSPSGREYRGIIVEASAAEAAS